MGHDRQRFIGTAAFDGVAYGSHQLPLKLGFDQVVLRARVHGLQSQCFVIAVAGYHYRQLGCRLT